MIFEVLLLLIVFLLVLFGAFAVGYWLGHHKGSSNLILAVDRLCKNVHIILDRERIKLDV